MPQFDNGDDMGHPLGSPRGDLLEMRAYAPGDPLKQILWKVYARTGRLLVRVPEKAIKPCERTMAYFVAGKDDEATAGIARKVLETGMLGADFLFGADGEEVATTSVDEAIHQIVRSVNAKSMHAASLDDFLATGETQGIHACTLFIPAQPGPWLSRAARVLAEHAGPFRALVGVDGTKTRIRERWLTHLLFRRRPTTGSDMHAVCKVIETLRNAGADVTVVDRLTGMVVVPFSELQNAKLGA